MTGEIFVDTSGFYALLVARDDQHPRAVAMLKEARDDRRGFVTSDYVLDETATLLKARGHGHRVESLFEAVRESQACRVAWMDPTRFWSTQAFFIKHADQAWSFTDCVSFCLMHELQLSEALTKDEHFRQAGYVPLLT